MVRISGGLAVVVATAVSLAGCAGSVSAGPSSVSGGSATASASPQVTTPIATPAPTVPSTEPLGIRASRWCSQSDPPVLNGSADIMVPADTTTVVVCDLATFTPSRPDVIGILDDGPAVTEVVTKLNAIAPPTGGPVACTLIGGGAFDAVFVAPSGDVRVRFDRVNCVDANNGVRAVIGVGDVLTAIDAGIGTASTFIIVD